jgi:hypothetical protein
MLLEHVGSTPSPGIGETMKNINKGMGLSKHRKSGKAGSNCKQFLARVVNKMNEKRKLKFDKLDSLKNLDKK